MFMDLNAILDWVTQVLEINKKRQYVQEQRWFAKRCTEEEWVTK